MKRRGAPADVLLLPPVVWDVVERCLAEGGAPVAQALRGAIRLLPEELRSPLPAAAADGAWERFGIHGHELEREEHAAARAHVVRKVEALVTGAAA